MSSQTKWIGLRIVAIGKRHPSVTEAVANRMTKLMEDQFRGQSVSQKDLAKIATALIKDMVPAKPESEAKR